MKSKSDCSSTKRCWGYRHEVIGMVLLVLATLLTLFTGNGFGIAAMFVVGFGLCCYKCFACHCCHVHGHCHTMECEADECKMDTGTTKRTATKAKPKA